MKTSGILVLFAALVLLACSKKADESAPTATVADDAGARPAAPTVQGCALAKACGAAAVAAGAPWSVHGRGLVSAGDAGNNENCNRTMFVMLRASATEPLVGRPPTACNADLEALFTAVGRPFDHCGLLSQCGDDLAALGKTYQQEAALALDVSRQAIERGAFSGELVCTKTWGALLEDASNLDDWPKTCGGKRP